MWRSVPYIVFAAIAYVNAQTPVIGGSCSLGTNEVQIGGKSTQFFLKCESTSESPSGEGVWVVKSRAAAAAPATAPAPENVAPQHTRPKVMHKQPNICEQDMSAREGDSCAVSETCLQAHGDAPSSYLQCEQTKMMWHRRDCHDGTIFNFEQQACVVPKRVHSLSRCPGCYDQNSCTGCPYGYNYNSGSGMPVMAARPVAPAASRPLTFSAYTNDLSCKRECVACSITSDCPGDFECTMGCCDLAVCPYNTAPRGTCSTSVQCKPNETCVFGRCCATQTSKSFKSEAVQQYFKGVSSSSVGTGSVVSSKNKAIDKQKIKELYQKKMNEMYTLVQAELAIENKQIAEKSKPISKAINQPKFVPETTTEKPITTTTQPDSVNKYFGLQSISHQTTTTTEPPMTSTLPDTTTFHAKSTNHAVEETNSKHRDMPFNPPNEMNCHPLMGRNRECSLFDPCPDEADCVEGRCCARGRVPDHCPSALSFPATCAADDECPIASRCMGAVCCPLSDGSTSTSLDAEPELMEPLQPEELSLAIENFATRLCRSGNESLSRPAHCNSHTDCPREYLCEDTKCCIASTYCPRAAAQVAAVARGAPTVKPRCLASVSCSSSNSSTFCPPEFTCSLEGKCCRMASFCPDGSAPTALCTPPVMLDQEPICPSSSEQCVELSADGLRGCCRHSQLGQVSTNGLVCTYSSCSNNNPCSVGSCNNGYCCSSSSIHDSHRADDGGPPIATSRSTKHRPKKRLKIVDPKAGAENGFAYPVVVRGEDLTEKGGGGEVLEASTDDWPVGPPGYGFPRELADLDAVLIRATGDGTTCAAGFRSDLNCFEGECPPGLFCDTHIERCCPLLLPLSAPPSRVHAAPRRGGARGNTLRGNRPSSAQNPPIITTIEEPPRRPHPSAVKNAGGYQTPFSTKPSSGMRNNNFNNNMVYNGSPYLNMVGQFLSKNTRSKNSTGRGIAQPMRRYQPASGAFASSGCSGSGCGTSSNVITIPEGGAKLSLCRGRCPRGYTGCCMCGGGGGDGGSGCSDCGCCPQTCGGGVPSLGRCFGNNMCSRGQCTGGMCCPSNDYDDSSVSFCPGGGYSSGSCNYGGSCNNGYSCYQGSCCPSYQPAAAVTFTCPGGGSPVGSCVNGGCASGYNCNNNYCCAAQNPFVCIDGTQAVGACVNSACGTGYTCNNGLCCSSSSATPRCLDGSPAVGACIPSCTGDMCGGVTVTYSCGSGYTCTTGNICCQTSACPLGGVPIGPPVNGLCPGGYTLQGNQCCSTLGVCPEGTTYAGPLVNGECPTATTRSGSVCCSAGVTCNADMSSGPCIDGRCPTLGYACDAAGELCCPVVDYTNPDNIIGPAIDGQFCPAGYTPVKIPGGDPGGECVDLNSATGVCAVALQTGPCPGGVGCPTGSTCVTVAEVCCPTTTMRMHRMPSPGAARSPYKPVSQLMPPRSLVGGCPDGSGAASACINGLCGAGLSCVNDLCCAISEPSAVPKSSCPDGQPAISGCFAQGQCGGGLVCVPGSNLCCPPSSVPVTQPPTTNSIMRTKPIGARCDHHPECVGYTEGLSQCEFAVCRCTPIAYTQGIACVRRKKL